MTAWYGQTRMHLCGKPCTAGCQPHVSQLGFASRLPVPCAQLQAHRRRPHKCHRPAHADQHIWRQGQRAPGRHCRCDCWRLAQRREHTILETLFTSSGTDRDAWPDSVALTCLHMFAQARCAMHSAQLAWIQINGFGDLTVVLTCCSKREG